VSNTVSVRDTLTEESHMGVILAASDRQMNIYV
jgi:hypothetical protein